MTTPNTMKMVGEVPFGQNFSLTTSYDVDIAYGLNQVDALNVENAISSLISTVGDNPLATELFTQFVFSTALTKSTLSSSTEKYLQISQWGAPLGFAALNKDGKLPASELPSGMIVNYPMASVSLNTDEAGNILNPNVSTQEYGQLLFPYGYPPAVTTLDQTPVGLALQTVPAPGYPWIPWPFAWVQGQSISESPVNIGTGTGNAGLLTLSDVSTGYIYGTGACSDSYFLSMNLLTPGAPMPTSSDSSSTALTGAPAYTGSNSVTFQLSGSSLADNGSYLFLAPNLTLVIFAMPASVLETNDSGVAIAPPGTVETIPTPQSFGYGPNFAPGVSISAPRLSEVTPTPLAEF